MDSTIQRLRAVCAATACLLLLNCSSLHENRLLVIITMNIEHWYKKVVQEITINIFYLKMQLPCVRILESLSFSKTATAQCIGHGSFFDINISQRSVATRSRRDGIFNDHLNANFLQYVTVKEFWKSVIVFAEVLCWVSGSVAYFCGPPCLFQLPIFTLWILTSKKKRKFGVTVKYIKVHGGLTLTSFWTSVLLCIPHRRYRITPRNPWRRSKLVSKV